MKTQYWEAKEVKKIADRIIEKNHFHLGNIRIEYVFVSPTPTSKGKEVWGRARVITGLNAYLSREDDNSIEPEKYFCIEISNDVWKFLNDATKEALVDHELSHCWVGDAEDRITTISHDVEEFSGVVRRHGLWQDSLKRFMEDAKQPLFGGFKDSEVSSIEITVGEKSNFH